jgi:hypothetical protein
VNQVAEKTGSGEPWFRSQILPKFISATVVANNNSHLFTSAATYGQKHIVLPSVDPEVMRSRGLAHE